MFDRAVLVHIFNLGIRDAAMVFEKRRKPPAGDVTGFVNGRRQDGAAEFTVPDRIVGAPTEERDAERRSGDDHTFSVSFSRMAWLKDLLDGIEK